MPLTASQIVQVKRYLGYDAVSPDPWRSYQASGLDFNVTRLTTDGVAQVTAFLADLLALDTSLTDARSRLKATQVGELRLNAVKEINALLSERGRVSRETARLLGVPYQGSDGASSASIVQ
jgi:hypothetical protein